MRITHNEKKSRFDLYADSGMHAGELEYALGEYGMLFAEYTGVSRAYEGQGLGGMLLDALAAFARVKKLRIVPECEYVVHAFNKHPEKYADVMVQYVT